MWLCAFVCGVFLLAGPEPVLQCLLPMPGTSHFAQAPPSDRDRRRCDRCRSCLGPRTVLVGRPSVHRSCHYGGGLWCVLHVRAQSPTCSSSYSLSSPCFSVRLFFGSTAAIALFLGILKPIPSESNILDEDLPHVAIKYFLELVWTAILVPVVVSIADYGLQVWLRHLRHLPLFAHLTQAVCLTSASVLVLLSVVSAICGGLGPKYFSVGHVRLAARIHVPLQRIFASICSGRHTLVGVRLPSIACRDATTFCFLPYLSTHAARARTKTLCDACAVDRWTLLSHAAVIVSVFYVSLWVRPCCGCHRWLPR